jgi:hypothetical protein
LHANGWHKTRKFLPIDNDGAAHSLRYYFNKISTAVFFVGPMSQPFIQWRKYARDTLTIWQMTNTAKFLVIALRRYFWFCRTSDARSDYYLCKQYQG